MGGGIGHDVDHRRHPVGHGEGVLQGRAEGVAALDPHAAAARGIGDGGVVDAGELAGQVRG